MFPSGRRLSRFRFRDNSVRDPHRSHHAASLARRTGATIVPVFVEGRNSLVFQALGTVHPMLRTLMLPRELVNKEGHHVPVLVGGPVVPELSGSATTNGAPATSVCAPNYWPPGAMPRKPASSSSPRANPFMFRWPPRSRRIPWLARSLPCHPRHSSFPTSTSTFTSPPRIGSQHPAGNQRLREVCFRKEGEGSGKERDIDRFDAIYEHLFLWDREARAMAGAYRVARTDIVLRRNTALPAFTPPRSSALANAFWRNSLPGWVRRSLRCSLGYQRAQLPLLLLWRGVTGASVAGRDPRYHRLFGPVSISNTYCRASKWLMTQYLPGGPRPGSPQARRPSPPPPPLPQTPHRTGSIPPRSADLRDGVEDVSALISNIEADGKGVPIILKHYLKMHTTLLSASTSTGTFSNCLDGLIRHRPLPH